jgi:hypothetical protein
MLRVGFPLLRPKTQTTKQSGLKKDIDFFQYASELLRANAGLVSDGGSGNTKGFHVYPANDIIGGESSKFTLRVCFCPPVRPVMNKQEQAIKCQLTLHCNALKWHPCACKGLIMVKVRLHHFPHVIFMYTPRAWCPRVRGTTYVSHQQLSSSHREYNIPGTNFNSYFLFDYQFYSFIPRV